jgi:hypothetical protein
MFTHRFTRAGAIALAVAAAAAPAAIAKPTDAPADYKLPHDFQTADRADTGGSAAPVQRGLYEPMKPEDQPQPAQDFRMPDTIDAANGRGTEDAPEVVVVKAPQPAPQPAADGMDWADIGLGAGTVTGFALVALGGGLLIVRKRGSQQLA